MAFGSNTLPKQKYELADAIMDIDFEIWDEYGFSSRPSGDKRRVYLEAAVDALRAKCDVSKIDDDVIYILEDNNAHSVIDAIDVVLGRTSIEDLMEKETAMGW